MKITSARNFIPNLKEKMKFQRAIFVIVLSLATTSGMTQELPATYMPKGGYLSTTKAEYIEPSLTRIIKPNQKISILTARNFAGETVVQKLTEHTYWVQTGFYNVVFYIGTSGVLLFDSLADGSGANVLKAIASVTNKPVTTLVYSHSHIDHIGDAQVFADAAKKAGKTLRIIASDKTANKLSYIKSKVLKPTEKIAFNLGEFKFEGLTVRAMGFEHAAHADDSAAWLLVQEGVIHVPDLINPDQMPYLNFGGSENYVYYPQNLQQIAKANWTILSGGHGNIGSRADMDFMQTYIKDLEAATSLALSKVSAGDFFVQKYNSHQAAAAAWTETTTKYAVDQLRPKYGNFYGFEASVPKQVEMVIDAMLSYQ
jgi:glyoxylase-like metal-dependent hydrolase (beta-lactamase superfamily II)